MALIKTYVQMKSPYILRLLIKIMLNMGLSQPELIPHYYLKLQQWMMLMPD